MLPHNKQWLHETIAIITFAIVTLICALAIVSTARGETLAATVIEKVQNPSDWLSRHALKYGFLITVSGVNALRMDMEASRFSGKEFSDNYHNKNILYVAGLVASGYLLYAVCERKTWTWQEKVALIGGTLGTAREAGEFMYQYKMHGDPFNNNPLWHEHEFTYPKWSGGRVIDGYIATGRISTPASHLGITAASFYLLGRVH